MTILEQKKTGFFERQMSPPPQQRKFKLQLHDSIHVPENFHPASNKITDLYHETNSFPPPKKNGCQSKKKIFLPFGEAAKVASFFWFFVCNSRMPRACESAPAVHRSNPSTGPRYAEVSNGMASNRQGHGWVNFKGLLNVGGGLEEWKLLSKLGWIGIIIY